MKSSGYFFAVLLLIGSVLLFGCDQGPHVEWTKYSPENMNAAFHSGHPVIVYFYAAWCGPCMELKTKTFKDERIIQALEGFEHIKVDMSLTHSDKIQQIAEQYSIQGLPTLIFYDTRGKEQERYMGYYPPPALLEIIRKFKIRFRISTAPKTPAVP